MPLTRGWWRPVDRGHHQTGQANTGALGAGGSVAVAGAQPAQVSLTSHGVIDSGDSVRCHRWQCDPTVSAMAAIDLEEVRPDESIAELEKRWGISRNALKARAKALGVELIRQGPTLTVWPGDRIDDGDRLDTHLKAGGAMASFPGVSSAGSEPAVTPQGGSDGSRLAVTAKGDQLAVLAAAVAAAMPQPAVDPLARARGLAEAADLGLVLTNEDMAGLLGQGVSSWRDGHQSYGYVFARHKQGSQVLWTVARAISAGSRVTAVTASESKARPGFRVPDLDVAASSAITVTAVALPQF